jgi:glycosyltransferase involved in cell wall biosynthesis
VAWFGGTAGLLCGRFDAVLVGHQVHNLAIWSLWARRRLLGRPRLAITGHMRFSGGLRGRLQRLLLRSADAILPYTESGAAACMAAGLPRDRLFVLNTTLDTTRIRAAAAAVTDAEAAAFRQARDLDTTPLFLFVGRLYREKRCDVAIEAVRLLRRQGRPCQLVIIGEGGERAGLERIAGEDPGIRFVGAERDDRVLALWGRLGLALVLPDAVGLAAVHALALGLPVVAARDGRHHCPELDYVRDGVTGLFADRCEPGDIAATLARLIDSPPLLDHLKAGCAAAAAELSVERMAGVTLAALRHALEAPPEPDRRRALPGLRPGA